MPSWILTILSILSGLQNSALVQDIEACVLNPANNTPSLVWACVWSKIAAHPSPTPADAAKIECAKALAKAAGL